MAHIAVLYSLVHRFTDGLVSQISYDVGGEVDKNLRSLQDKLSWLLACIKDADKTKGRENERAKLWMSQIIDIAHDAEDAMDDIIHNMARRPKKRRYFYFLENGRLRREAEKIEDILQRIDGILSNKSQFGIENPHVGGGTDSAADLGVEELLPPLITNEEMDAVGMDDDASLLAEKLIQGTEQRHVVSIVGMGGIGKTTLAKMLYNRDDIMENFECRAWVCVSLECKVKDILEGIIKCLFNLTKDDLELLQRMNESDLRRLLHQHLQGKRYLVVLDDVWHEEAWDSLKAAFPAETTRSRLLTTTRNREVALHADANGFLHQREFLGEEESWNLFCQKAFPNDISHSCPSHLEMLGRKIVSKCGGLPLAIASVGKLLSTKGNLTREWVKVEEMVLCKLLQECKITSRLSSSYLDLPYDLKSCFLHFAAFPKGFEIRASTLIKLWIAEGFIEQRGEEPIEDTAEDCLNKLVSRSMIQVAKVNCHEVKTCRIHDLQWDLSISETKEVKFLELCGGGSRTPSKVRRLSITQSDSHSHKGINFHRYSVHLRSLYFSGQYGHVLGKYEWSSICKCFSFLRVLHLHSVSISDPIDGVENLVHLRYLGLRDCDVKFIPPGISNLRNLQTLDLRNNCIAEFLDEIWELKQLRHLRLEEAKYEWDGEALIPQHVELSHFANLRTLTGVRAGKWMYVGKEWLTDLRKLVIDGVTEEYKELFSRFKLTKLKSLKFSTLTECLISLSSFSGCPNLESMHLVGVLEKVTGPHQFPPYLTKLTLRGSQMGQDSLATLEKLQNLSTLKLKTGSYVGSKMIFTEGGFPRLQVLIIDCIMELEELIAEGRMPNLRKLVIADCPSLKEIPVGAMSGLTHEDIIRCPMLNEFLRLKNLQDVQKALRLRDSLTGGGYYPQLHGMGPSRSDKETGGGGCSPQIQRESIIAGKSNMGPVAEGRTPKDNSKTQPQGRATNIQACGGGYNPQMQGVNIGQFNMGPMGSGDMTFDSRDVEGLKQCRNTKN